MVAVGLGEAFRMMGEGAEAWEQRCEELRAEGYPSDSIFDIIEAEAAEERAVAAPAAPEEPPAAPPVLAEPAGDWKERLNDFLAISPTMDYIDAWLARDAAETATRAAALGSASGAHPLSPPPQQPVLDTHSPVPVATADPVDGDRLRAQVTAEVYTTMAAGLLPMAADAMATVRVEALEAARRVGDELTRLHEHERARRVLAAAELHQVEAEEAEELATFRGRLAVTRLEV